MDEIAINHRLCQLPDTGPIVRMFLQAIAILYRYFLADCVYRVHLPIYYFLFILFICIPQKRNKKIPRFLEFIIDCDN